MTEREIFKLVVVGAVRLERVEVGKTVLMPLLLLLLLLLVVVVVVVIVVAEDASSW